MSLACNACALGSTKVEEVEGLGTNFPDHRSYYVSLVNNSDSDNICEILVHNGCSFTTESLSISLYGIHPQLSITCRYETLQSTNYTMICPKYESFNFSDPFFFFFYMIS